MAEIEQPIPSPEQTLPEGQKPSAPPKKQAFTLPLIFMFVFVAMVILGGIGWFWTQQNPKSEVTKQQTEKRYSGKITISYTPWPGYIGLFIARDKGYFAQEGLDVELRNYPSLADASKDYVAGNVQGKANLTLEALNEAALGLEHQIVLVIDYSNGSDGIIATQNIQDISQVKGKKVGYEFGTLEDFFLTYALQSKGLSLKDIQGVNLTPEHAAQALIDKKVDVAVTYEPYLSPALQTTKGKKIYSSADSPGLITDILTFNKAFIDKNPETIAALVRAYFKAYDFLKTHPQEAYQILAKEYKTTPEDIEEQLKGVHILTLEENKASFTTSSNIQSLYGNLEEISKFVDERRHAAGKHEHAIDTDALVNGLFINKMTQ